MKKWYLCTTILGWVVENALGVVYAPMLNSPMDGATNQALRPTLTWFTSGAGSYKVQISKTGNFNSEADLIDQGFYLSSSTFSYKCAVDLLANSYYKWRVVAFEGTDNSGNSAESLLRGFYTQPAGPGLPTLTSPSNGATGQPVAPTLQWTSMPGATFYWYQIATSTSFPSSYTTVYTNYDLLTGSKQLYSGTNYYWRAAAGNCYGNTAWTSTWSFTTAAAIVPSVAALNQPIDNSLISGSSATLTWSATNATYYWVQVATNNTVGLDNAFLLPILENKMFIGISWALTGLSTGTKYYWHVQAFNSAGSGWSVIRSFTCIPPSGAPVWPRGDATQINSPFGPRNESAASSWFHTGVDIAGSGFKAPYNMVCVIKSIGISYLRLVFKCLDAGKDPTHLQFVELDLADQNKVNVGTSFSQGANVGINGGADPAWIHMDAFQGTDCKIDNEDDADLTNNSDGSYYYDNRTKTKNPLQWFPATSGGSVYLAIYPDQNATTFPKEGTVSYFDVYLNSTEPKWTLDQIQVDLTNQAGNLNNAALQDQAGSRISFNNGLGIDRTQTSSTTSEINTNFDVTLTGASKTLNGVKVFTNNVDYTYPYTKALVFRYYLSSTDVASIRVSANDFNGVPLITGVRSMGAACVNCPGKGPLPPDYLSATPCGNGIELRWNKSPDRTKTTYYYSIYRRLDGSSEMPLVIAIVPYMSLTYSDLFSNIMNTLMPGKKYRYSIASIGERYEGCNGPQIPNCTGSNCPISCVAEKVATAPSNPGDIVFQDQVVRSNIGTIAARNSIVATRDQFRRSGSCTFTAGYRMDLNEPITIEDGSPVIINVTH